MSNIWKKLQDKTSTETPVAEPQTIERVAPVRQESLIEKKPEPIASSISLHTEENGTIVDESLKRTILDRKVFISIKPSIQEALKDEISLDEAKDKENAAVFEKKIETLIRTMVESQRLTLTKEEKEDLIQVLLNDTIGLGPLEPLLKDDTITEIMVNHKDQVYVERNGQLYLTRIFFDDEAQLRQIAEKILNPLNRRVDEKKPYEDARLADGSRVNIIIPPLAVKGTCITIRKFKKDGYKIEDLVKFGTITTEAAAFLKAAVEAKLNVCVSGGTGSGKTTTLNILSSFISPRDRVITIEDAAELQLKQPHVITLESRPASANGDNAITIQNLLVNTLRMRPDRIIVGECRSGEALDMLQAMNTGHDGSMTTGHANTPRDFLSRLETMVLMAGMDLPVRAIREQIASAIDLIVQQNRMTGGVRRMTHITEVVGMEAEKITLEDIFLFESEGFDSEGKQLGKLIPRFRPKCMEKIEQKGIYLPKDIFLQRKA